MTMKAGLPRELRLDERLTIEALLNIAFLGRDELLAQLPFVRVVEESTCCPSIKLLVDPRHAAPSPGRVHGPIIEAECIDEHGEDIEILLRVEGGYLDDLQVVHYLPEPIRVFPTIDPASLWAAPAGP